MYWEHGYTDEDIVQRLRLNPAWVRAITSKDYTETLAWDEDISAYTCVRTARTRNEKPKLSTLATEPATRSNDKDDVIRQQLDRIAQSAKGIQTPKLRIIKL